MSKFLDSNGLSHLWSKLKTIFMRRYIIRLTKSGDAYLLSDYSTGASLDFNAIYNKTRDTALYVVVVYGNSKLRPQYVSTNEMLFVGLDRATDSKVLRLHITPTAVTYQTYGLMETTGGTFTGVVTYSSGKKDTDIMYKSGGTFSGTTIHPIGTRIEWDNTHSGGCLRNINVKDSGGTAVATDRIIMHRK